LAVPGWGKRGGVLHSYYWDLASQVFYMLYLYTKNAQGDMTPTQVKVQARPVGEEFT